MQRSAYNFQREEDDALRRDVAVGSVLGGKTTT